MQCPYCHQIIDKSSKYCQYCGYKISKLWLRVLITLITACLCALLWSCLLVETVNISVGEYKESTQDLRLEILNSNGCVDKKGRKYVCGTVVNNDNKKLSFVEVYSIFYNKNQEIIGTKSVKKIWLKSQGKWEFKIPIEHPSTYGYQLKPSGY